MQQAQIRYRSDTDRWSAKTGKKEYGLHCGKSLVLSIAGRGFPCTL